MRTNLRLVALAIACGLVHARTAAQETDFTYQGILNQNGNPLSGYYDFQFRLFDAVTNGNLIAGLVTNTAEVASNGIFTTIIDFGPRVFTGQNLWLDIAVSTNRANAFDTLHPRQKLMPVPYALYSPLAGTANTANTVVPGGVSVSQLNTVGAPGTGQVLAYNGSQLVWQNPSPGGATGGWSLTGNLGTTPTVNFLGTADNQPLELKVGGARAMRLEPDLAGTGAPNVIGGSPANSVSNSVIGATIAGGGGITVSGTYYSNRVTGAFGTIGGGVRNLAGNQFSTVGGGFQNAASGYISAIAGGAYNVASDNEAFIGGGAYNSAALYSVVAGGDDNAASGVDSVVVGGLANTASGQYSFVGGGTDINSLGSTPVGNIASGDFSVVVGGNSNHATQQSSTVGGGEGNTASGVWSTVAGGVLNEASGAASFAAGYNAHATTQGAFVWADNASSSPFTSSANYQFLVRANGGVGIGTAQTPPGGLRVDSGGLAVTGASSPQYGTAQGVFLERLGTAAGALYAYDYSSMTPSSLLLNSPGGNVGIGTLTPQNKLDVNGSVTAHGLSLVGGTDVTGPALDVNGTTRTHALTITGGADLAEPFKMAGPELPKGSVVVIDENHPGELKMSTLEYDTKVVGIVSGANGINCGIALHQEGSMQGGQNVALSGRVYVQADATFGVIKPGDLLTTSATPGHAMKVSDRARGQGAILGKAMTGLLQGRGMVLVLVTLQ